ncbi:type VI immunity family protein [Pseudomonas sp. NPDC089758]|uniref:type VI immunity family protein n=1 Tax=Pseudomonas sp. NPDC089758 TaxID=3364473 RepID=UPI00382C663C
MSTTRPLFTAAELDEFSELLKEWPNSAFGNEACEIGVSPFLSFYFPYSPEKHQETMKSIISIHKAFEALLDFPYVIATHPVSEKPYPYSSTRIPDITKLAEKWKIDESFTLNFTDEPNHGYSPSTAGYFWRSATWDGVSNNAYSSILLYYRWSWWLENREQWRNLTLKTIDLLEPHQVYCGLAVANPLEFGARSEAATWERSLAARFYGLDIEFPFGMRDELMDGIRPPTWGFFLSDYWREKLALDREAVQKALNHPNISIKELRTGQWIELGERPSLYPVENGLPELPIIINKVIKPIRHKNLGLIGFGQWSGDPNERFSDIDAERWLGRFDEESDWPLRSARFNSPRNPQYTPHLTAMPAGSQCPVDGWWTTPAKLKSRKFFAKGEIFPDVRTESAKGHIVWLWDNNQGLEQPGGSSDA